MYKKIYNFVIALLKQYQKIIKLNKKKNQNLKNLYLNYLNLKAKVNIVMIIVVNLVEGKIGLFLNFKIILMIINNKLVKNQ